MSTTVEIYADIWCPFAHVGLRAARAERERRGRNDVNFVVHPWPLELVNARPLDPAVTARQVGKMREHVAPDLFAGFDVHRFPTSSLPALALAHAGYERDAATGEALSWALRDALFEEGRDIGQRDVLDDIARRFDVDATTDDTAAVRREWHRGQARGVQGSPHFFCDATGLNDAFCPSLNITRDESGVIELIANATRLVTFLDDCLGAVEA